MTTEAPAIMILCVFVVWLLFPIPADADVLVNDDPDTDHSRYILDDELVNWFSDPTWDDVIKLFILDACHTGGFIRGDDGAGMEPDLSALPNCAVIAAADESTTAVAGLLDGRGELTRELLDALTQVGASPSADINGDGLSFTELASYLNARMNELAVLYPNGLEGFIKEDPIEETPYGVATITPAVVSWAADGFAFMPQTPAPLPGDADVDGDVDLDDFVILKTNFGLSADAVWDQADFDGDGDVDLADFVILKNNFGATR